MLLTQSSPKLQGLLLIHVKVFTFGENELPEQLALLSIIQAVFHCKVYEITEYTGTFA